MAIPCERLFEFWGRSARGVALSLLLCSQPALAQSVPSNSTSTSTSASASAPAEAQATLPEGQLQARSYQVGLQGGVLTVGSPHTSFLYAYSADGRSLLWKRELSWPMTEPPRSWRGMLLLQQPGQPAVLLQPETGELRQRLHREDVGWTVPWGDGRWVQLSSQGDVRLGSADWKQWVTLGRLRLARGDAWLGAPTVSRSFLYVTSKHGRLQRLGPIEDVLATSDAAITQALPSQSPSLRLLEEEDDEATPTPPPVSTNPEAAVDRGSVRGLRVRNIPGVPRPLTAAVAHPDGVVQASLDGRLALRRRRGAWQVRFPGWGNCYGSGGQLLASPTVDALGRVLLCTRDGLSCYSSQNGTLLWRHPCQPAAPVVMRGVEPWLLTENPPALSRLDPTTGSVDEFHPLPAGAASPLAVSDERVALVLQSGAVWTLALTPAAGPAAPPQVPALPPLQPAPKPGPQGVPAAPPTNVSP